MHSALAATASLPIQGPALLTGGPSFRPEREAVIVGATRAFTKDEGIFAGDRTAFVYKVVSGAVRTCKLLNAGRRQVASFHLPGVFLASRPGRSTASPPRRSGTRP